MRPDGELGHARTCPRKASLEPNACPFSVLATYSKDPLYVQRGHNQTLSLTHHGKRRQPLFSQVFTTNPPTVSRCKIVCTIPRTDGKAPAQAIHCFPVECGHALLEGAPYRICRRLRNYSTSHACLVGVYRVLAACLRRRMVHMAVGRMRTLPTKCTRISWRDHGGRDATHSAETSWIR